MSLLEGNQLRLCIYPRELNKALQREHNVMTVLEDTLHELRHSTVFNKVFLSSAYLHIKLDEELSNLTTFQTCFGLYRFLR